MEPRVLTRDVKGDGDPVVLVPGGLTGWVSWLPHAERLSARWKTVRVQPIHNELGTAGERGRPGYDYAVERESLRMTLDDLGIHAAHLAGWSAGGQSAIEFAIAYPDRVRTLTLVEPGAYWILERSGEHDPGIDRLTAFLHGLFGKEVTEEDLASFLETAGFVASKEEARSEPGWERWASHRMALSWYPRDFDRPDASTEDLGRITCPVLLVKGSMTTQGEKRVVARLAELLPHAAVLELDGDHASHIQSIDRFIEAFERHLHSEPHPPAGAIVR